MTELLEGAFALARTLPPRAAEALIALLEDGGEPIRLTPDEIAAIVKGEEQAARGEFASDDEMRAVWANSNH